MGTLSQGNAWVSSCPPLLTPILHRGSDASSLTCSSAVCCDLCLTELHLCKPSTFSTLSCFPGLRFVSSKGERLDIVYGNIRHGIFQPCEKEHVVLLHFHLRHAIMVGKKKFKDIQFFTEVVEASQALDGRLRSDYDQDESHAEEREHKLRIELNKAFKKFVERVEEVASSDPTNRGFSSFDVPQREIGFTGAPFKEMSFIMPCAECLISVVDKPVRHPVPYDLRSSCVYNTAVASPSVLL